MMRRMRTGFRALAAAASMAAVVSAACQAAEPVVLSAVGSSSANLWPTAIGMNKGFFAAEDLNVELVFGQSNAGVNQQRAAGSVNFAVNTGLVDPIRAIEKGASAAIIRIEVERPPYILVARSSIKSMRELKGKTISVGGAKDITRLFLERMLATQDIRPGEFDMIFAGATSARFAALTSGAVDAALIAPPFNYRAEAAGFNTLGTAVDKVIAVYNRSIAWFYDARNRSEAAKILVDVSKMQLEDVEKAYDFLTRNRLLEPTGKVSKAKLGALVQALQELGDIPAGFEIERLILPGVTKLTD